MRRGGAARSGGVRTVPVGVYKCVREAALGPGAAHRMTL